jgi:uncharacterized protein
MTATRTPLAATPRPGHVAGADDRSPVTDEQHSLPRSILLHLFPGIALTAFVILAAPSMTAIGLPPAFALFVGIPLVIVPLELGYLLWYAKRTTGSWSLSGAIDYRTRLPRRRVALLAGLATLWFMVFFVLSTAFLDDWLAENLFAWLPDAILQFSTLDGDGQASTAAVGLLLVIAFVFNGFVGPVVEELYFRGHLLPRIDRLGRWAPVLNTTLFSLYHLWTPWQNPARIIGFLPISWTAWRQRNVTVAIAAHITINVSFLLLMFAAIASGA